MKDYVIYTRHSSAFSVRNSRRPPARPASTRNSEVIKRRRRAPCGHHSRVLAGHGHLGQLWPPCGLTRTPEARLDKAQAGIAGLTAEKADLESELGRLSEADYLESLARQDLSYMRPGEDLIIVTGADGGAEAQSQGVTGSESGQSVTGQSSGTAASGGAGFLERVLTPIL